MKRRQLFMVLGLAAAIAAPVQAQQFFRIGTGGTAGVSYWACAGVPFLKSP